MANTHEVAGFLWSIANEVLRDDFNRSKYPDVILPFVVLRRLDCVLGPARLKRENIVFRQVPYEIKLTC